MLPGDPERRTLGRGDLLFRQGEPASAIYLIETGRLRLERHTPDGRRVIVHTACAGELFAEAALFSDRYHCDAVAIGPSRVRVYRKPMLLGFLDGPSDRSSRVLLEVMARQLQLLRQRLELRNIRSSEERLLLFLEMNAEEDGRTVIIQGELQDIAAEIGLTREALYRGLARLARKGLIRREAGRIVIRR
jgi:CRP-like cAMP-binding protein